MHLDHFDHCRRPQASHRLVCLRLSHSASLPGCPYVLDTLDDLPGQPPPVLGINKRAISLLGPPSPAHFHHYAYRSPTRRLFCEEQIVTDNLDDGYEEGTTYRPFSDPSSSRSRSVLQNRNGDRTSCSICRYVNHISTDLFTLMDASSAELSLRRRPMLPRWDSMSFGSRG